MTKLQHTCQHAKWKIHKKIKSTDIALPPTSYRQFPRATYARVKRYSSTSQELEAVAQIVHPELDNCSSNDAWKSAEDMYLVSINEIITLLYKNEIDTLLINEVTDRREASIKHSLLNWDYNMIDFIDTIEWGTSMVTWWNIIWISMVK